MDISAFARKTKSTVGEASRAIKLALFSGVIQDTRVDTGRLRGNWQTSTGAPIASEIDRLDPSGADATNQAAANVTSGGLDFMTNNLPYAGVWEEKDGMIAKNMARIQRNVEEVARGRR